FGKHASSFVRRRPNHRLTEIRSLSPDPGRGFSKTALKKLLARIIPASPRPYARFLILFPDPSFDLPGDFPGGRNLADQTTAPGTLCPRPRGSPLSSFEAPAPRACDRRLQAVPIPISPGSAPGFARSPRLRAHRHLRARSGNRYPSPSFGAGDRMPHHRDPRL